MFFQTYSAAVNGLVVSLIRVEVDISDGLPAFLMIGRLSSEIKEAGDRLRPILKNAGMPLPPKKITVNLAPANIPKEGTSFDLPILIALLGALGHIPQERLEEVLILGEVSLSGDILPVRGVLPILLSQTMDKKVCILPEANVAEASVQKDVAIIGVSSIKEVFSYFSIPHAQTEDAPTRKAGTETKERDARAEAKDREVLTRVEEPEDFADIKGQEVMKRAAVIAVAGMHNILMVGLPGSGKTMLARRLPTIQPELTMDEMLEISKIYSVRGMLEEKRPLITRRPFRAPHHSITAAALIGGGRSPAPGEISLAHKGVLFLDELPEFPRNIIELLRQPLEERQVTINRSRGSYTFPCHFQLVVSMNPCPCGYYPDLRRCNCTPQMISHYRSKLSGPFLDRIDLCVSVSPPTYEEISGRGVRTLSSKEMRSQVEVARKMQSERYGNTGIRNNASLTPREIEEYCALLPEDEEIMRRAYTRFQLTARSFHKVLKVARTIADLDAREQIARRDLTEALSYRQFAEMGGED